ncbi:FecR domain-containing protein [Chitinophaga alhagiae]|uniref:FecR domain-containing protein n=1 Tax=Chitinophaga alhagiae TaxID=2203219 RepID=UPI000E5C4442|nr:FecR domain-containing protein [Chitinophaga alhagiae]
MKNAKELLDKYLSGQATSEEKALVESWYLQQGLPPSDLTAQQMQEEYEHGLQDLQARLPRTRRLWPRWAAAAAVLLGIAAGLYYLAPGGQPAAPAVATYLPEANIPPGGNQAVLTLASGKKVSLADAPIGRLASEEGLHVDKTAEGELLYSGADSPADGPETYNTITTPPGGQYQVTLPDGSRVWLNAASSLRYPVRFLQHARQVELSGEAYFEVNKQTGQVGNAAVKRPFLVQARGQQVEVLGTHFNINAYTEEGAIRTTLLEGSVRVRNTPGQPVLLQPGQMAVNGGGQEAIRVMAADVNDVMAWKKGLFIFNNENIRDIMTRLARWYNIEVRYEGDMTGVAFQGNYQRSRDLVNLLRTIEQTNSVRFKIEGNKVTVIKQ